MQITKKGFSPNQLMFGRQGVIPGITDGNPASMEPIVESDWFRQELSRRQRAEELYRQIDSNKRLQKLMTQATSGATDAVYVPGDEVFFKEKDKSKWSGPAEVTNVIGNKIRMIYGGFERTVFSIDVAHSKEKKTVVQADETNDIKDKEPMTFKENNIQDWEHNENLPADWQLKNQRNIRPKLHDKVEFTVKGCLKAGRVRRVGKSSGNDKYRCWVQEGNKENSYDFLKEVENWRKVKNEVTFDKESEEARNTARNDRDDIGIFHLKSWDSFQGLEGEEELS
jgi:hypothetical protein